MYSIQNAFNSVASCDDFEIVMINDIPCYKYHGNSYLAKLMNGRSLEEVFLVEYLNQFKSVSSVDEEKKVEISNTFHDVTEFDENDEDSYSKWLDYDVELYFQKEKVTKTSKKPYKKSFKKVIRTHDNDIKLWEIEQTIEYDDIHKSIEDNDIQQTIEENNQSFDSTQKDYQFDNDEEDITFWSEEMRIRNINKNAFYIIKSKCAERIEKRSLSRKVTKCKKNQGVK